MADSLETLPRPFYNRSPEIVARELIGKILLREHAGEALSGRIIETEAYLGFNDPASHTCIGPTSRNAVLFGPSGHAYIYFIYGKHFCLNVSCLPEGEPGGVLFRAPIPLTGRGAMRRFRGLSSHTRPPATDRRSWAPLPDSGHHAPRIQQHRPDAVLGTVAALPEYR